MKKIKKLETGKLKKLKQTKKILLPKSIDLDLLVNELPQKERIYKRNPNLKKDEFAFLIHNLLTRIVHEKEEFAKNKFVGLHSKVINKFSREYSSMMRILENNKIILIDHYFIKDKKTMGYAFGEGVLTTDFREYDITTQKFIKLGTQDEKVVSNGMKHIDVLISWLKQTTIEEDNAIECLNRLHEQNVIDIWTFYQNRMTIMNIVNKQWYFKIDQSAGRVHTTITSLKKELRDYLNIWGRRVEEKDMPNCQPLGGLTLFDKKLRIEFEIENTITRVNESYCKREGDQEYEYNNRNRILPFIPWNIDEIIKKPDVRKYILLVSKGKLYQFLHREHNLKFPSNQLELKEIKKRVLAIIFSPSAWESTFIEFLRDCFPNVFIVFDYLKIGFFNTNNGRGSLKKTALDPPCLLAILLQNIEANLVIHRIVPDIIAQNSDIPIITIHDAILSFPEHMETIEAIMGNRKHEITKAFDLITKEEMQLQEIQ